MPYLPSDAAKKSQLYSNIVNGDTLEYQNEIDDLKKKQQISGSANANTPLRDKDGILVSFESETPGISLEEDYEAVRLENKQFFFTGQLDNEFTYYFQPITEDTTTTTTATDTTTTTEEVEFALTLRDYLIQVVNEYFAEELTPEVSTDKLHSKLNEFFKLEGPVGGARNTNGWKEFRLDKIKVKKFTKKGKKGKLFGGRSSRHNYRSLKDDLKKFTYDDVINKQLYHTRRGQQIWLQLGFPYIKDR